MSKPLTLKTFFEVAKGRWAAVGNLYTPSDLSKPNIPEDFMPWLFKGTEGGELLQAKLIAPSGGGLAPSGGLWRDVEDVGFQAMGKKSREKRERMESGATRAPRSDVVVLEDGISFRGGQKEPFTLFYLKVRKEWQEDSNPDLQKVREVMVFLDEKGHFATAVKLAMIVKGGDSKIYRSLSGLVSRPMSDDRVAEVEAFAAAEYARLFPYDHGLPIENNIYGWLLVSMDNYRTGRINAAQMEGAIGKFAEISPVRPELTAEGFKIGLFELSRNEALKIAIGSLEKTVSDFLGQKTQAAETARSILESFHGGRQTQTTAWLSKARMFADATTVVFLSELLDYLKRPDIPEEIKEKVAIISMLGTREGTFLSDMFSSDISADERNSKGAVNIRLSPSIMSPAVFSWKVEAAYRKVFGLADGPQKEVTGTGKETKIEPLSLDAFFRLRRDVERMDPRRSLTVFRYTDYFARFAIGRFAAFNVSLAAMGPDVSMGFRATRRLLSNKRVPNETRAMVVDIFLNTQTIGLQTLGYVTEAIIKLERDMGRLCERVREIYSASYPEAPDVLRAAEKLPKSDARSMLSGEKFSEHDTFAPWKSFLAEAKRQGFEDTRVIEVFAEASAPAGSDQKIYERWIRAFPELSADERVNLWKLLKSNNLKDVAVLFQDHLFPPRGAWAQGATFNDRMGFLLPSEFEALQATLAAAAEDTAITYNIFTSRYPDAPLSDHSDLPMWLKYWPQNGGGSAALDDSLHELSKWVHGEGPLDIDTLLARELVRRSVGDTLAIRSLIGFVSNPRLGLARRQAILSETARILTLGEVEGDLLGLVIRANVVMNGRGQLPSRAELSTVKDALINGWKVTLIPTDKKLSGPTPDFEAVSRDGKRVVIEVKLVSRGPVGDLGYLRKLKDQIHSAVRQLEGYGTGEARRMVHVYITGYGSVEISDIAMRIVEETVESSKWQSVDEAIIIPVDISSERWVEGAWVRAVFDHDVAALRRAGETDGILNKLAEGERRFLERLSPAEKTRVLIGLDAEHQRLAPLKRMDFAEFVTQRIRALSGGTLAEGIEATSAARERDGREEGRKEGRKEGADRDKAGKMERAERPVESVK